MSKHTQAVSEDLSRLAGDARAWAAATAGDAKDRVGEVRDCLAGALDRSKARCGRVRDQARAGVKVADEAVHEHPYPALAIAFGIGAILGGLLGRTGSRNGKRTHVSHAPISVDPQGKDPACLPGPLP